MIPTISIVVFTAPELVGIALPNCLKDSSQHILGIVFRLAPFCVPLIMTDHARCSLHRRPPSRAEGSQFANPQMPWSESCPIRSMPPRPQDPSACARLARLRKEEWWISRHGINRINDHAKIRNGWGALRDSRECAACHGPGGAPSGRFCAEILTPNGDQTSTQPHCRIQRQHLCSSASRVTSTSSALKSKSTRP